MQSAAQSLTLPSVREMLTVVFKDRRRILWSAGITFAVACAVSAALTPRYEATSSLLVTLGSEYAFRPEAGATSAVNSTLDRDQILRSEIEILGSSTLHVAAIRKVGLERIYPEYLEEPGLLARMRTAAKGFLKSVEEAVGIEPKKDRSIDPVNLAVEELDRHLGLVALKDGNVIEASFRHEDAQVAADFVNALVSLYLERRGKIYEDIQSPMVKDQAGEAREKLEAASRQLASFKSANGISNYDTQREILLRQRGDLADDERRGATAIAQLSRRLDSIKAQLASLAVNIMQYSDIDADARVSTLRTSIQDLRGKEIELRNRYEGDSRPVTEIHARIAGLESELKRIGSDKTPSSYRLGRNPTYDALDLDRLRTETDLRAELAHRDEDVKQLGRLDDALGRLRDRERELQMLELQRSVSEEAYRSTVKLLADRRITEDIAARKIANVRVIEAAQPPIRPKSLTLLIVFAGAMMSCLVALAVAALSEHSRRGYLSPEKLERSLGIPVLVSVPETEGLPQWGS
jgi:uncharacterized protein involved in exopolysaccharide biosynthesis